MHWKNIKKSKIYKHLKYSWARFPGEYSPDVILYSFPPSTVCMGICESSVFPQHLYFLNKYDSICRVPFLGRPETFSFLFLGDPLGKGPKHFLQFLGVRFCKKTRKTKIASSSYRKSCLGTPLF